MNRCPVCERVFTFNGVQTRGPKKVQVWRRWDECEHCNRWYIHDEQGMPLFDTGNKPEKHVFASW